MPKQTNDIITKTLLAQAGYEETPRRTCGNCMYFVPKTKLYRDGESFSSSISNSTPHHCKALSFRTIADAMITLVEINPKSGLCNYHASIQKEVKK